MATPKDLQRKKRQSGQGTIEYILILAFAVSSASLLSRAMKSAWEGSVLKLGGRLEQSLKTGRVPYSAWKD